MRFTRDEWITRLCGDHRDAERAQSRTCGLVALPASWGSTSCSTSGFGRVRKLPAEIAALAALAHLDRVTCSDSVASQPIEKRNTKLSGDFLIVPLSKPSQGPHDRLENDVHPANVGQRKGAEESGSERRNKCCRRKASGEQVNRKLLVMGVPAAGKTTLAHTLAPLLNAVVFDAHAVRANLARDLGVGHQDSVEHAPRMGSMCDRLVKAGGTVIADFVFPTTHTRAAFGKAFTTWLDRAISATKMRKLGTVP